MHWDSPAAHRAGTTALLVASSGEAAEKWVAEAGLPSLDKNRRGRPLWRTKLICGWQGCVKDELPQAPSKRHNRGTYRRRTTGWVLIGHFPQDTTHAHTSTAQVVSTQPQRVGRHPGEHRTPARTTRVNRCTDDVPAPSWNTLGALPIVISQPSDAAPVLGSPEWHVTAACVVEATSKATTATATIWVRGAIVLRAVARTPLSERSSEAQLKNAQGVAKSELNRRNNTPRQVTVPCPHCGVRSNGF